MPYIRPIIAGYNANPPSDDGAEVSANQITWAKHINKIGDPLRTYANAINGAVEDAFDKLYVPTITALKALASPSNGDAVVVTESGRAGTFVFSVTVGTENGGTTFSATDLTPGLWHRRFSGPVDVRWFGAVGDGVADESAALQLAFNAAKNLVFPAGSYRLVTTVTASGDDTDVDFGAAIIINEGPQHCFRFGTIGDDTAHDRLTIRGGRFTQADAATASDRNYIRLDGIKSFLIAGVAMRNVSNGGIFIGTGCADGVIDSVDSQGATANAVCRSIWLNGGGASDYADQLVITSSLLRNATPVPANSVQNIRIVNCTARTPQYGVYLINTRGCSVVNCNIEVTGAFRCITVNNYSPDTVITGNTLRGSTTSRGILISQVSTGVIVSENLFLGTFSAGSDLQVSFLASAMITNNTFSTDTTQQIDIDTNATAYIKGNVFTRSVYAADHRAVRVSTLGAFAGTSDYGNTATVLDGSVITDNVMRVRNTLVYVQTPTSAGGNIPAIGPVIVTNNVMFDRSATPTSGENGMLFEVNSVSDTSSYQYFGNTALPPDRAARNRALISGAGLVTNLNTALELATFQITVTSGAVAVTKRHGANFSCATSRSTNDLILSPRTIGGASGAAVANPVSIHGITTNVYSYDIVRSGTNYQVRLFDASGTQITISSVDVTIDVIVSGTET